jgi:hypothetical protein
MKSSMIGTTFDMSPVRSELVSSINDSPDNSPIKKIAYNPNDSIDMNKMTQVNTQLVVNNQGNDEMELQLTENASRMVEQSARISDFVAKNNALDMENRKLMQDLDSAKSLINDLSSQVGKTQLHQL